MNSPQTPSLQTRRRLKVIHITRKLLRHWLAILVISLGILNTLPFLAPVALRLGWTPVGDAIYTLYSTLCHQMAQRSFFLFGPQAMYNLDKLPLHLTGNAATDVLLLREFRGNPELGWKVAWSDRMVAMYGGLWLVSLAFSFIRRNLRLKPVSLWITLLFMLPMAIDGISHMVSDLNGLTTGFRYTNEWLAMLTTYHLSDSFYRGDALGSFNSWMRLISGVLFSIGVASFGLPLIEQESHFIVRTLSEKLSHYDSQPHLSSN